MDQTSYQKKKTKQIYGASFDLSRGLRRSFPIWYECNSKIKKEDSSFFSLIFVIVLFIVWMVFI